MILHTQIKALQLEYDTKHQPDLYHKLVSHEKTRIDHFLQFISIHHAINTELFQFCIKSNEQVLDAMSSIDVDQDLFDFESNHVDSSNLV